MQVKLLRVLQEFEFEQVGGTKTFHVDARVILATNENLDDLVADGPLPPRSVLPRERDQYRLPPLRERVSDIPLLATALPEEVCEESGRKVRGFTDEACRTLQRHRWPGNVRELQNVVERAVLLGKGSAVGPTISRRHYRRAVGRSRRSRAGRR